MKRQIKREERAKKKKKKDTTPFTQKIYVWFVSLNSKANFSNSQFDCYQFFLEISWSVFTVFSVLTVYVTCDLYAFANNGLRCSKYSNKITLNIQANQ